MDPFHATPWDASEASKRAILSASAEGVKVSLICNYFF